MKAHFIIHVKTMNANIFQGWPPWRTVKAVVANRARPWRARTTRNSSQATPFTHLSPEAAKIAPNEGASKPKRNSSPVLVCRKKVTNIGNDCKTKAGNHRFFKWKLEHHWTIRCLRRDTIRHPCSGILGSQLGKPWRCPPWCEKRRDHYRPVVEVSISCFFSRKVAWNYREGTLQ